MSYTINAPPQFGQVAMQCAHFQQQYVENGAGLVQSFLTAQRPMISGKAYVIVCDGQSYDTPEGTALSVAQDKAEQLAHQHQAEAFILKPIRKVAPKRDVVTTDLP